MTKTLFSAVMSCFLSGCSSIPPSDENIVDLFKSNTAALDRLVEFCREHPNINSIEWKSDELNVRSNGANGSLSAADTSLTQEISGTALPEQIDCLRIFEGGVGKLTSVRFVFFGSRFGFRRAYKALERDINAPPEWREKKLKTGELRPIGEPNWYIYEPNDGVS